MDRKTYLSPLIDITLFVGEVGFAGTGDVWYNNGTEKSNDQFGFDYSNVSEWE